MCSRLSVRYAWYVFAFGFYLSRVTRTHIDTCAEGDVYTCRVDCALAAGKRMRSATAWLGISGGLLMVILMGRDFRGAVITGILFVTFVSWIPDTAVRVAVYVHCGQQRTRGSILCIAR